MVQETIQEPLQESLLVHGHVSTLAIWWNTGISIVILYILYRLHHVSLVLALPRAHACDCTYAAIGSTSLGLFYFGLVALLLFVCLGCGLLWVAPVRRLCAWLLLGTRRRRAHAQRLQDEVVQLRNLQGDDQDPDERTEGVLTTSKGDFRVQIFEATEPIERPAPAARMPTGGTHT